MGAHRQGLSLRHRRRQRLAGRSVPRALAAAGLSLHVRARLQGGLPVLLGDRRRLQRLRGASGEPRRHALGGVARAAREAAGLQAAHGLDVSVGVLVRRATSTSTSTSRSPRSSSAAAASNTTTARGARAPMRRRSRVPAAGRRSSRRMPAPTCRRTRASGRA